MSRLIHVLLVEDNAHDAELLILNLRRAGFAFEWERADTEAAYLERLRPGLDLILSDFHLPEFSGLRALDLLNERGWDIPFILVSGTIGEDTAVAAIQRGAADYLIKDRLARLGAAVERALGQGRLRRERKAAEDDLRLFRALVDQSDDAFEVVDPETGRFLDVNAHGCAELGYTREEYLTLSVLDIDRTIGETGWPGRLEKIRQAGSFHGEGRHWRKDGTSFPVELRVKCVRLDREYMVASVRDISRREETERSLRESEERFRQLAENIHEVFWMTDPEKRTILYISPAYEAIWGRTCESLYASPGNWLEAIHPADREAVAAALSRRASGEYHETYRVVRPDGTVRWVRDRAFPIKDAEGRVCRIVGTAEDITERRELEEQFRQTQKLEAIGTLAGGIAHDFNNILSAIIGYAELTKWGLPAGSASSRYVDLVLQGAHRAASLVRQILVFSRREEQQQQRLAVQLRHLVEEPMKLLRATIPAMIEFDVSLAGDAPVVLADPTQVHQLVMNLCTNAAYAMRRGPGRLGVTLDTLVLAEGQSADGPGNLKPGTYARLTISDTGHGMDAATQERIFEPFFTTKGPGEGTGLGLSVVHGIMQRHEGAITVQSRPGEGTTFHLYFPAHAEGETALSHPAGVAPPGGGGRRVLFIDDELPLAELGRAILDALGYRVEAFMNPAEALERVERAPADFDLVITDLSMPGMTGLDLARRLLAIRPDLPIVLTTGHAANVTPDLTRAVGIRELLFKPFTVESLGLAAHRASAPAAGTDA